jgi:hypothetical protein
MSESENEIYLAIGQALHSSAGVLQHDDNDYIKLGKRWFADNLSSIQKTICTNQALLSKILGSTEAEIVAAVADALATTVVLVPPITVSRLIVKLGIAHICKNYQQESSNENRSSQ